MVDTSAWDGLRDVTIDSAAAAGLATACDDTARLLRTQVAGRRALTMDALRDFEGRFSQVFRTNQETADGDGEQIATALEDVARLVRHIVSVVPAENSRRRAAREWKERHDEDKGAITLSDLGGDEAPPEGPTSPPAPEVLSATASPRDDPRPGSGAGSAGTSSARPAELRSFVSGVGSAIQELDGRPGRLEGLNNAFTDGFDWGTGEPSGVDGAAVYAGLRLYNQLNRQDTTWVDTVAEAFERAGSVAPGGMVVLSDAALASSLRAAGVSVTRHDIPATSPRLYGVVPDHRLLRRPGQRRHRQLRGARDRPGLPGRVRHPGADQDLQLLPPRYRRLRPRLGGLDRGRAVPRRRRRHADPARRAGRAVPASRRGLGPGRRWVHVARA